MSVSRSGAIKLAFRELGMNATVDQIRDHAKERHGLDVTEKMIEMIRRMWGDGT